VRGHEVDDVRCDLIRRDGEVSLIFAILVVNDDEDLARAEVFNRLRNGSK